MISIPDIISKKQCGVKIVMLTAYDYPTARLVDQAGVDMILVGDSLANVVLGLDSTTQVGMAEMLHHTKAVSRATQQALVVADMPYEAYQVVGADAVICARRLVDEAGCGAVKLEWFDGQSSVSPVEQIVRAICAAGIPVMGHVGLTPQTAQSFKVQGKDLASARAILDQARAFEAAGCFAVVLECVPESLAHEITAALKIPTIGIGAGKYCDGQVLVLHDVLGLTERKAPKFVKQYIDLKAPIKDAVRLYREDVVAGRFPGAEHTFH